MKAQGTGQGTGTCSPIHNPFNQMAYTKPEGGKRPEKIRYAGDKKDERRNNNS